MISNTCVAARGQRQRGHAEQQHEYDRKALVPKSSIRLPRVFSPSSLSQRSSSALTFGGPELRGFAATEEIDPCGSGLKKTLPLPSDGKAHADPNHSP